MSAISPTMTSTSSVPMEEESGTFPQVLIEGTKYIIMKQSQLPPSLPVVKLAPEENPLPGARLRDFCRLCARTSGDMVDIFGTEGQKIKLDRKIHYYTPIVVSESDSLPLQVCCPCVSGVEQSHCLATSCLRAQNTLNNIWQQEQEQDRKNYDSDLGGTSLEIGDEYAFKASDFSAHEIPNPSVHVGGIEVEELLASVFKHGVTCLDNDIIISLDLGETSLPPSVPAPKEIDPPKKLPFNCKYCQKLLKTPKLSRKHYLKIHNKYLCEYCFVEYDDENSLTSHQNETHLFYCTICQLQLMGVGPNKLKYHIHKKHPEIFIKQAKINKRTVYRFGCKLCDESVPSRYSIKKHYLAKHEKHACALCLGYFNTEIELQNHIQIENHDLQCKFCDKEFVTKNGLNNHLSLNHKENELSIHNEQVCKICKSTLSSLMYLKRHYFHVHNAFNCSKCLEIFYTLNELDIHSLDKHGQKSGLDHNCNICNKVFDDPSKLQKHIKRHEDSVEKNHLCEDCGKSYHSISNLNKHKKFMHENKHMVNKFTCTVCSKQFLSKQALMGHMIRHKGEKNVKCPDCSKLFYDTVALKAHKYVHSDSRNFCCELCTSTFRSKRHLHSHLNRSHISEWIYSCNICSFRYSSEQDVLQHFFTHKKEEITISKKVEPFSKTSNYQCHLCGKYNQNKHKLKIHVYLHKNNQNMINYKEKYKNSSNNSQMIYQCDICTKIFKTKSYLKTHLSVHMVIKPFQCMLCPNSFSTSTSLKNHIRVHTNEKPFGCQDCGKRFHVKSNLVNHVRFVHLKVKNYICNYCGKSFGRQNHLVVHERTHTNERPYKCRFCGQLFKQQGDVRRHEDRHSSRGTKLVETENHTFLLQL